MHSLFRLNDQYFVQGLGVEAQSAVAVGSMVAIWFLAFAQMVSTGTLAITARRLGEGETERAREGVRAGLRTAVVVGAVLAVLASAGLPALCALLIRGDEAAVGRERALALEYLQWIAAGQIVLVVVPTVDAAFFAMKNMRTPLLLECGAISSNAALNALLVPVLGVGGAGLATVASRALTLAAGLWLLQRAGVGGVLRGPAPPAVARRILAIGAPACISISIYSLVYQVILAVTFARFGPGGRSALGIGFGIESIFWCFFWGIGTAVATLVGRALGEGRPDRAEEVAAAAARVSFVLGAAVSVVFWTLGPALVGIFAESSRAFDANVEYLRVLAWAQPAQALQVIYEQALIGAGATLPIMVGASALNAARIPLAHLLAVVAGQGLPGIWWAVNLSSFGKLAWCFFLFRRGGWKHRRL